MRLIWGGPLCPPLQPDHQGWRAETLAPQDFFRKAAPLELQFAG